MLRKLFLKQAARSFQKKLVLYTTFSMFLMLTITIFVGIISFTTNYFISFNKIIGKNTANAQLKAENKFLPAWVPDKLIKKFDLQENYTIKEKQDENKRGILSSFLEKQINDQKKIEQPSKNKIERLLLSLAYNKGSIIPLSNNNLLEDKLLSFIFGDKDPKKTKLKLDENNGLIKLLNKIIYEKYQTNNIVIAYFIEQINQNSNLELMNYNDDLYDNNQLQINNKIAKWQYLTIGPNLINYNFYANTPKVLRTNRINNYWLKENIKWSNNKNYLKNFNFIYVTPNFLNINKMKIGNVVDINFEINSTKIIHDSFLIAGIQLNIKNFYNEKTETVSIPYQYLNKIYSKEKSIPPNIFGNTIYLNVKNINNLQKSQNLASKIVNNTFYSMKNSNSVKLQTSINWINNYPTTKLNAEKTIFKAMTISLGILLFILIYLVFYFVSQEIFNIHKEVLFFLKSLGTKKYELSIITTFSMLIPFFIGFFIGFFSGLFFQKMMIHVTFQKFNFTFRYWNLNIGFYLSYFLIFFIIWLSFYFINILIMNKTNLTTQNLSKIKISRTSQKIKKNLTRNFNPKIKIGLSFAFKNIYKNFVTFFILSNTFGVILYTKQFDYSLKKSTNTYEKWNQPYKSVVFSNNIKVFSQSNNNKQDYVYSFESIFEENSKIEKIDSETQLESIIKKYKNSLTDSKINFNWNNYFLSKNLTKKYIDLSIENPNKIIKLIKEKFKEDEIVNVVLKIFNQIMIKYINLKNQFNYDQGFNIYFGKLIIPQNNRHILAFNSNFLIKNQQINSLAFAKNDIETMKYFNFNKSMNTEDFLIKTKYYDYSKKENKEVNTLLKVNISKNLQTLTNLKIGQVIKLKADGFKTAENQNGGYIYAYINDVIREDIATLSIYTSQQAIAKFFYEQANDYLKQKEKNIKFYQLLFKQKNNYNQLFEFLNNNNISNSIFENNKIISYGIQNILLPYFQNTDKNKNIGSKIEDFYDQKLLTDYFNKMGNNMIIFKEVTKNLSEKIKSFNYTLKRIIFILILLAFVISIILIILILFENRSIILLFKIMGYYKSEINWYLLSGYFISAFLSVFTAIGIACLLTNGTKQVIFNAIQTTIDFTLNWQLWIFALMLGTVFCSIMGIAVVIFTKLQKPRDGLNPK